MTKISIRFLLVCAWLLVLPVIKCKFSKRENVGIFVFGDSLFDPGNMNNLNLSAAHKANHWPYGETFFNFSTGRFCDGRIVPDFIAMKVNLPLWKPYLEPGNQNFTHGANFAAYGAGVLPETFLGATISLPLQMSFFENVVSKLKEEIGEEEAQNMLMESIYLSSIGGNDYVEFVSSYPNTTLFEQQEFVQVVIGNLTQVIKEIYEMGGRKFAFQNVGPMGCLPIIKKVYGLSDDECLEELMELARLHNKLLLKAAEELQSELFGFKYSIFEYYTSLYDIIKNPSKYGFLSSSDCCDGESGYCGIEPYELCNNASEYVYFDHAHPTQGLNILLSNLMWDGNSTFSIPYDFKTLFDLQNISHFSSTYHLQNFTKNYKEAMNGFTYFTVAEI